MKGSVGRRYFVVTVKLVEECLFNNSGRWEERGIVEDKHTGPLT
jgi:hypothetical protein